MFVIDSHTKPTNKYYKFKRVFVALEIIGSFGLFVKYPYIWITI